MNSKTLNIFLIIAIVVLVFFLFRSCSSEKEYKSLIDQKNDTLKTFINKDGQQVAVIALMQSSIEDFKKLNAGKDSSLKRLQKLVDAHTIVATIHDVQTSNTIVSNQVTVIAHDTIFKDSMAYVYPEYRDTISNKWEHFIMSATNKKFTLDYKLNNEFDYQIRYDRLKWYKPRVAEISATNLNPHTVTNELKSFAVIPPKGQKLIVFLSGIAIGSVASFGLEQLRKN